MAFNQPTTNHNDTITVESVEIVDKIGKNTGRPYKSLTVAGDGKTFKGFYNNESVPIHEGDIVEILYTLSADKKYRNITSYVVKQSNAPKHAPVAPPQAAPFQKKESPVTPPFSSKENTSMEVSGLLQALIASNNYSDMQQPTLLDEEALENALDFVLRIKRAAEMKWKR